MIIPNLAQKVVLTKSIQKDDSYQGLRIVRAQTNPADLATFEKSGYEFQSPTASYIKIHGTLSRKGVISADAPWRILVTVHPTLSVFVDMVRYDPSNPPPDNYDALKMREMHERTQSDFKGQKAQNKIDFRDYILEGIRGDRPLYLPTISGWQSSQVFDQTIFVALDESNPNCLYGIIYLPKSPLMQSDGQTQTAALFSVANSKDAVESRALENLVVTLEIELNMDERKAGQSFADRNGRGSKKNKNLVISLDTSSALSELRVNALAGTIFESRLGTGRDTSTSEKSTKYLVDLSTMEQMLLNVVSEGKLKTEHFKHFHVNRFLPFARDFIEMLEHSFGDYWEEQVPATKDPFRKIYVHGWPFALKALAIAYHRTRIDEIGPLLGAIGSKDAGLTVEEAYNAQVKYLKQNWDRNPVITATELRSRVSEIDWLRYRAHWVKITGHKQDKDGNARRVKLKSTNGVEVVVSQAQNTASVIGVVANKILSPTWEELKSDVNY
ncbi:hypothetical protein [Pseudomonas ogarae]